ncbi:Mitochondrial substrate/solute carrier [Penicillium taxi]|uniref:Mitochondrial substrate/solute carrier n=1 Tax=Penicillium taxi TaxID=168475 RepID=UPI00254547D1|nr:Mitochondrial substrate/solute carrier [Penicillium taxi]KAJ5888626.1 Mitochondrial substrate/solute carrier [Penicillium taxi]
MPFTLHFPATSIHPESPGSEFATDIDSSLEAKWTSLFDNSTIMAQAGTDTPSTASSTPATSDISIGQRMISATAGNIFTGLLGKYDDIKDQNIRSFSAVTPLDVVRVRLQSQNTLNASQYTSHTTHTLKNLPPNLGITACCREVFWVGDNVQMCMMGPQSEAIGAQARPAIDCAVEESQRRTFTSTIDGLRKIARNEGFRTLWRGLSPTLMMGVPANIIYFAGYDWMRTDDRSLVKHHVPDAYAPFIAGAIARTAAAAATSPVEMFRTRLQATPGTGAGHFKATLQELYKMTQAKGYTSLWRGLSLTMWRDVPFSGLYWWGYEKVKHGLETARQKAPHLSHTDPDHSSSATAFLDSFIAGASSGAVAAFVTTPFDVGKTRQQVFRHIDDHIPAGKPQPSLPFNKIVPEKLSLPKFLLHIFREEGTAGLFSGWSARCLKVAPACAIMISTYELGKRMAREVNERRHTENS